jgi:hypothetical protein
MWRSYLFLYLCIIYTKLLKDFRLNFVSTLNVVSWTPSGADVAQFRKYFIYKYFFNITFVLIHLTMANHKHYVTSRNVACSIPDEATQFITYSVALVRKRTIPTERPPLLGEVSANFCGKRVSRGQRDRSLRPYSRISRHNLLCKSYK